MNTTNTPKRRTKTVVIRSPRKSVWSRRKLIFLFAFFALIAVIVYLGLRSAKEKTVSVSVTKATKQNLTSFVSASGEVKPKKNVNISAHVSGRIVKIGVEEGQPVKSGDFLLKLDATQYEANADRDRAVIRTFRAELIKAEAQLKKDENYYSRQKRLFEAKLISRDQLEAAEAQHDISKATHRAILFQIKQAEASLESAMDMLGKTVYNSPIDGIITSLRVEEGEIAMIGTMNNPGTILMTIADLSIMQVEVDVDETDVIGLKIDQTAKVRIDALPGQIIEGKVTEIGSSALRKNMASEESKDFKVIITLENPPESLKPGLSASADIITAQKFDVLALPISSLVLKDKISESQTAAEEQQEGIFLVNGNRVQFHPVKTGILGEMMVEILSGVEMGQEVVTGPYSALRQLKDEMLIRVEPKRD
ncbi:MAG: efflux RND transporter periplasmic adaptor subunit [Candidatus Aminicenantes bacterium]|nr:efflux RND transporter periplasmic adaptor subunit [Candidatus Aminicenantes bacterium]